MKLYFIFKHLERKYWVDCNGYSRNKKRLQTKYSEMFEKKRKKNTKSQN